MSITNSPLPTRERFFAVRLRVCGTFVSACPSVFTALEPSLAVAMGFSPPLDSLEAHALHRHGIVASRRRGLRQNTWAFNPQHLQVTMCRRKSALPQTAHRSSPNPDFSIQDVSNNNERWVGSGGGGNRLVYSYTYTRLASYQGLVRSMRRLLLKLAKFRNTGCERPTLPPLFKYEIS